MRIASASRSRVRPVTSNGSTVTVTCALCVGAVRELYLPATLKSIADAVDLMVVNDDSGLARSESDAALEAPVSSISPACPTERSRRRGSGLGHVP